MTRAHDATDTAITQATVHLVARHQDPTVGAVAQATGVARGTVYRYLPTRQALLSTVLDQGLGKAERHLSQANLTAVPVAESLTRAVRALVAQGRLSWCSLISGCSLEGAPRASPLWSRCWDRGRQGRSWVAICPSHVRLRRCIPLVQACLRARADGYRARDPSATVLQFFLEGSKPPPARASP